MPDNDNVLIVYLDTYTILAHTVFDRDVRRIEISEHLKEFPELYELCLAHEKKHAQWSLFTWRHFWLDLKDRFKLLTDTKLRKQLHLFHKHSQPQSLKEGLFMILYNFGNGIIAILLVPAVIATMFYGSLKNRRRQTLRLFHAWHAD